MADHVPNVQPDDDLLVEMSRRMLSIRKSEEPLFRVVKPGRPPVQVHMSDGHGAVACATCVHLEDRDRIASSHRGQRHGLAKAGIGSPLADRTSMSSSARDGEGDGGLET